MSIQSCCFCRSTQNWTSHSHQKSHYMIVALSVTCMIAGTFLLLAAYQKLPTHPNSISQLGHWGSGIGIVSLTLGALGGFYSRYPLSQKKDSSHQAFDYPLPPTSWSTGPGAAETEQTLEVFKNCEARQANEQRRKLCLVAMDMELNREHLAALEILKEYVSQIHGIETSLVNYGRTILCKEAMRGNQYECGYNIGVLKHNCPEDGFMLGFTSYDIYPKGHGLNFVFGGGFWQHACGFISLNRLGGASFETLVRRILILGTHEFGHMRGFAHCTQHRCNMQGSNHLGETDATPLFYCRQDMEKICLLNQWTLGEGYQRQLACLQKLSQKGFDFAKDIQEVQRRISLLQSEEI